MTIAVAQNALFNKYANTKGVTTVTIGSAMLQFMGNGRVGDKDISKIAGKLKSIRILDCERPSITSIIYKEAQQYYHKYRYVVAMDTNEDGEHTTIYMKEYGKGLNEFALLQYEKSELQIINILGYVNLNDIKGLQ
jgi:hypothetical protein